MAVGVFTPLCHRQGRWLSKGHGPHIASDSHLSGFILGGKDDFRSDEETGPERLICQDPPSPHHPQAGKQSQNEVDLTPEACLPLRPVPPPAPCPPGHTPSARQLLRPHAARPAAVVQLPACRSHRSGPSALHRPPTPAKPSGPAWHRAGGGGRTRHAVGRMPGLQPLWRRSPTLPRTTSCRIWGVRDKMKTCRSWLKTHTAH